jgi:hypothetical protein
MEVSEMAAVAGTFESHPRIASRVLLTHLLAFAIAIGLVLTISALGSTTMGSPKPRPQTGPPVTLVAPISGQTVQ